MRKKIPAVPESFHLREIKKVGHVNFLNFIRHMHGNTYLLCIYLHTFAADGGPSSPCPFLWRESSILSVAASLGWQTCKTESDLRGGSPKMVEAGGTRLRGQQQGSSHPQARWSAWWRLRALLPRWHRSDVVTSPARSIANGMAAKATA
jgi:hypothetical protein